MRRLELIAMRDGQKVSRSIHETTNKMVVSTYEYMRKNGQRPIMTELTSKTIRIIYQERSERE